MKLVDVILIRVRFFEELLSHFCRQFFSVNQRNTTKIQNLISLYSLVKECRLKIRELCSIDGFPGNFELIFTFLIVSAKYQGQSKQIINTS